MHSSVRAFYRDFSATSEIEGLVKHMYLDTKGLVTIGIGTLIEQPSGSITADALRFAFTFKGDPGHAAGAADILADFNAVKHRGAGAGLRAYDMVTRLEIGLPEIDRLVREKLDSLEARLRQTPEFAGLDRWPADAQLGLLSMAYAMGGAFAEGGRYPSFRAACAALDFTRAARESRMRESDNPNVKPRNWANELMFTYAARVLQRGRPIDQLVFPNILTSSGDFIDMGLAPMHAVWPTLRPGASGQQVAALQKLLGVSQTASFDDATRAAVVAFQSASTDRDGHPLTPDGIVGLQTWRALVLR